MASERTVLMIADIGGYTTYMRTHRMSLAHAEVNTGRLLEAVIDAAPAFELIEIEGDAAFLARNADRLDGGGPVAAVTEAAVVMHRAFHVERRNVVTNLCPCHACSEAADLKLKFVAHLGEAAWQRIRDRRKLVGIDVIHVHRMLKSTVDAPEYVLLSEQLYRTGEALPEVREVSHELEGIGPTNAFFVEIEDVAGALPPPPEPAWPSRIGRTLDVAGRGLPYMLGLRRRRRVAAV